MRPPAGGSCAARGVCEGIDIMAEEVDVYDEIADFGVLIEAAAQCAALIATGGRNFAVSGRYGERPSGVAWCKRRPIASAAERWQARSTWIWPLVAVGVSDLITDRAAVKNRVQSVGDPGRR